MSSTSSHSLSEIDIEALEAEFSSSPPTNATIISIPQSYSPLSSRDDNDDDNVPRTSPPSASSPPPPSDLSDSNPNDEVDVLLSYQHSLRSPLSILSFLGIDSAEYSHLLVILDSEDEVLPLLDNESPYCVLFIVELMQRFAKYTKKTVDNNIKNNKNSHPNPPVTFPVSSCNPFEKSFFYHTETILLKSLQYINIAISYTTNENNSETTLSLLRRGKKILLSELYDVLHDLYVLIGLTQIFNLKNTMEIMVNINGKFFGEKEIIGEEYRKYKNITNSTFTTITTQTSSPTISTSSFFLPLSLLSNSLSGESFMAPYELSFECTPSSRTLSYPPIYELNDHHIKVLVARFPPHFPLAAYKRNPQDNKVNLSLPSPPYPRSLLGPLFLRLFLSSFFVPSHEFFHIIQHHFSLIDTSPSSSMAEYEASVMTLITMLNVMETESKMMEDMVRRGGGDGDEDDEKGNVLNVVEGLKCMMMMMNIDDGERIVSGWDENDKRKYLSWRDSKGMEIPTVELTTNTNTPTDVPLSAEQRSADAGEKERLRDVYFTQFKSVVAVEYSLLYEKGEKGGEMWKDIVNNMIGGQRAGKKMSECPLNEGKWELEKGKMKLEGSVEGQKEK